MDGIKGEWAINPANFSIFEKYINAYRLLEHSDPIQSRIKTLKLLLHKGAFLPAYCQDISVFSKEIETSIMG
jgi:hypothetical protein